MAMLVFGGFVSLILVADKRRPVETSVDEALWDFDTHVSDKKARVPYITSKI
jgi:hypothetical protein